MRYQQKRPENGVSLISKTPNYVGRHAIDTSLYHFEALINSPSSVKYLDGFLFLMRSV